MCSSLFLSSRFVRMPFVAREIVSAAVATRKGSRKRKCAFSGEGVPLKFVYSYKNSGGNDYADGVSGEVARRGEIGKNQS